VKQPGTTKKHAGTSKHGAAGKHGSTPGKGSAKKHTPVHESAHERKLRAADAKAKALHHVPSNHNPAGPKQPQGKSRKLALGSAVACCSAESLAASLRLAGQPVYGSDVYALHRLIARGDDDGATILATLKAASTFGLAGVRLAGFQAVPVSSPQAILGGELPGSHAIYAERGRVWSWGAPLDMTWFPDWEPEEAWRVWWSL
jgi:hypothetical protein